MALSKKQAKTIANLISSIEANHIIVSNLRSVDRGERDYATINKWLEWRSEDYSALQAMGIPVHNPLTDSEV